MKIAHREISPTQPPLVIAEIGINHGGSLDVARAMVTAAHRAGCEMVKHQTHFVDDEMTDETRDQIREELLQRRRQQVAQAWIEALRDDADIEDFRSTVLG